MQDPYNPQQPPPGQTGDPLLDNIDPIPDSPETLEGSVYLDILKNLQGNILKGHGRDHSANIFIHVAEKRHLKDVLKTVAKYITSAYEQIKESRDFKRFLIPGSMFQNVFLTAACYRKLGFSDQELQGFFGDKDNVPPGAEQFFVQPDAFLKGMRTYQHDLGDIPEDLLNVDASGPQLDHFSPLQLHTLQANGRIPAEPKIKLEPLEEAYTGNKPIDILLLLADDDEKYLQRVTRTLLQKLEEQHAEILAVELGRALRNKDDEGIEHFGYVDGRSQPLFLASDFKDLQNGKIVRGTTTERINEKAFPKESGDITVWDPFEQLNKVLLKDGPCGEEHAYGSYFVFRKLEQDVLRFSIAEQQLADKLKLQGEARERAGAMAVGRFRDGTPLVLSETDGHIPAKANNFRYDDLDAALQHANFSNDPLGTKCPFQAHIRKTNPRQSVNKIDGTDTTQEIEGQERIDRGRRITRRGIPYGVREKDPDRFQSLDELPTKDVGLLFACFQNSIVKQFAFMQKTWVNNVSFKVGATGLDPLIGQPLSVADTQSQPEHHWKREYNGDIGSQQPTTLDELKLDISHPVQFPFQHFIKFRGGEFFFAPSLSFFKKL